VALRIMWLLIRMHYLSVGVFEMTITSPVVYIQGCWPHGQFVYTRYSGCV